MPVMLERWNDDKMDALEAKVDDVDVRLARVEVRLTRVEVRVDEGFKRTDSELLEQRREMKAGFEKLNDRLTHMLMAVMGAGATIVAAVLTASLV